MKKIKFIVILAIIVSLISMQSPCFAENMLRKLGRGTCNILTSFIELPKAIQESFYADGPLAAVTHGILDGLYKFTARTVVGVYEVVTFPVPIPAHYAPIIEPEFLFSPDEPYSF